MARRTKEEALETRERLLDAALDLFCEKGFSQTRLSDVADRIGMTRGALYWHFKDKIALLIGLLEKLQDRETQLARKQVPTVETLSDLKAYFVAHARVLKEDAMCRKLLFFISQQMEWSVEMREAIHEEASHLRERPFSEISETLAKAEQAGELRAGTDLNQVADLLIGIWMGLAGNYLREFLRTDLEAVVEAGFSMVLDAISAPK